MQKKLIAFAALLVIATSQLHAQVGIGTTSPDGSAILDLTTTTRGLLLPRLTQAQRLAIGTPANGLIVYQTDAAAGLWMYVTGQWVRWTTATDVSNTVFSTIGASSASAVNTVGSALSIAIGGSTNIPLPTQNLGSAVTVNGANTVFTVTNAGRYRIAFRVQLTAALAATVGVAVNGTLVPALTSASGLTTSQFSGEGIVTLAAGSTISLNVSGVLTATLLGGGQGAALTIQRVE
jgi:hypothetical protein